MKPVIFSCLVLFSLRLAAQDSLQQARLKSLQGKILPFSSIAKKDSLFMVCFWSVNSEESITELNAINTNLESWQNMKSFRFLAISVDEGKLASRMRPTYNMNGWTFESYVDVYGELRESLHANNLPQSFVIYRNKIIYEQTGWSAGSEAYLIQRLLSIKN